MAAAENDHEKDGAPGANILEMLNPDCWRAVLDYLDVDDVVRSERVSRGWQRVVLDYLEGVHNFKITNFYGPDDKMDQSGKYDTYRRVKLLKAYLDGKMLKKIGRYITTMVTDITIDSRLREISQNCPNLQAITFREYYVRLLLVKGSAPIEELTFNYTEFVSGNFLEDLKPNKLKSLQINKCALTVNHMVKALDSLTELAKLELNDNRLMDLSVLHICLEKMPKLEYLSLNGYNKSAGLESDVLFESIGRLGGLKYLSLRGNRNVDDAWLAAIARGCTELRVLDIGDCEDVSGRAVAAVCEARARTLLELIVRGNPNVTDADLAVCVASCRYLTYLDAAGCAGVTEGLAAAAAAARAREPPLRLRISKKIQHHQVHYDGLIVKRDTPAAAVYYSDSDDDYKDDYYDRFSDSDEGTWSDRVEEYLDSRDADY